MTRMQIQFQSDLAIRSDDYVLNLMTIYLDFEIIVVVA